MKRDLTLGSMLGDEIIAEAPKEEPARQQYFMEVLRSVTAKLKARRSHNADNAGSSAGNAKKADSTNSMHSTDAAGIADNAGSSVNTDCAADTDNAVSAGDAMKACVVTFGCQMNARDSEKLEGILSDIGFEIINDELQADFVAFNTCTVRENANEHLYGRLGRLKNAKRANPDMIISVCGCMMQETDEIDKLKAKYPYVDIIFGTHNLYTFPELMFSLLRKRCGRLDEELSHGHEVLKDSSEDVLRLEKLSRYGETRSNLKDMEKLYRKPVVSVWKDSSDIVEQLPTRRKYAFKQGINIMYGCNNFCSYCIVPYVRGREKSRAPEEIYDEINRVAADGVREIMLLGQNVNSYNGGIGFAELLKNADRLCDDNGIERIRFMTSHPKDLSDELIEVMAESKHICRQFHLPLQSGSSTVLKRMNRHYDKERYLDRAFRIKEAMPDISLSTDIIVGFPGETEEDFLETLDVIKQVRFDAAYTFIYSKREGTPAAAYTDQIDETAVKDRFDRLLRVQNAIVDENLNRLVGSTERVLFEEISEYDESLVTGKLENGITVHVPGGRELIGSIRNVKLAENHRFYFTGRLADNI